MKIEYRVSSYTDDASQIILFLVEDQKLEFLKVVE